MRKSKFTESQIVATQEMQRLVVSGKMGRHSSPSPGKNTCVPIDPAGEMVTLFWLVRRL